MNISTQIRLVKISGTFGSVVLGVYGLVALLALVRSAGYFHEGLLGLPFKMVLSLVLSAGLLSLTRLGCKLFERAFGEELLASKPL